MFFGALLCKDHLHTCILGGVEGNTLPITGSVEPADLPEIITAVGPYKTAHIVGCLHHGAHGGLLEGYNGL